MVLEVNRSHKGGREMEEEAAEGEKGAKVTVRLPNKLHSRLMELSTREVRSLNGQIVYLLNKATQEEVKGEQP
jgi:hypothetical protein